MKVELQCGDTITIPDGCKAIVKDGSVVFEKEEKEEAKTQDFKDGDVLTSLFDNKVVFIFKEDESKQKYNKNDYYVCNIYVSSSIGYTIEVPTKDSLSFCGHKDEVRLATNKEKQFLFNKMKENGLQWNAEEKRVEKIRWRAMKNYIYHRLNCYLCPTQESDDYRTWNQKCHDSYNYFHTEEQTKEAAKRVKETLRKYHEEIGE
jgi:hypothetical protein|nr:MAG TPA: hypothetical protein [Caudoviricetes sp.]